MASNLPNLYRGKKCRPFIKFFLLPILPSSKDLY